MIERIETHGKHLEIVWDDGLVLHTNLRMNGSWHLYRGGERWRRPTEQMRVVIKGFGVSPVVAINAFPQDHDSEHAVIIELARQEGVRVAVSTHVVHGVVRRCA